ncbi:MAG: helix-turn-helix transcriptional regulator [Lachnospiraceae bacterium]|nr:helix-turn-helix transcriptional regulator [Lachnospiraceae bacterium]
MNDYMAKVDGELRVFIEEKQEEVRQDVIAQYIKSRKEQHMTQADVADKLGVKRPNITRFENGSYNPTVDMLVKIAASMGKEVEIRLVEKRA